MSKSDKMSAFVLYVDHQGHPAPLSECYYATASRRLSSSVDRQGRPSTITQVDSAYCPQCLSFHDASSGSQLGYCPKPTCLRCPLCTSIISCNRVELDSGESCYCYTCGLCDWNSAQCNLKIASTSSSTATKEELTEAMTKLFEMLQERRKGTDALQAVDKHYKQMLSAWEGVIRPSAKTSTSLHTRGSRKVEDAWSVEALESAMGQKKADMARNTNVSGFLAQKISLEEEQTLDPSLQDQPVTSVALQALSGTFSQSIADLLPLAVPLRARTSRRCRAELAEGKPGILLKPKLNPLEGDSSLRTGHGQWWKKDSSAVHVLPRLKVLHCESTKLETNTQQHALLLKATNPTLGSVRLKIGAQTTYLGEPFWDEAEGKKNQAMEDLFVDTVSDTQVDAFLLSPAASSIAKSDLVELESAEDSFVDIGKVLEIPDEVAKWDAVQALAAAPPLHDELNENEVFITSVRLLANKTGSAWFELICTTKLSKDANYPGLFTAIPISLQIEVGKGSWESSLVQAKTSDDDKEPDIVSFDLVLTWSRNQ